MKNVGATRQRTCWSWMAPRRAQTACPFVSTATLPGGVLQPPYKPGDEARGSRGWRGLGLGLSDPKVPEVPLPSPGRGGGTGRGGSICLCG